MISSPSFSCACNTQGVLCYFRAKSVLLFLEYSCFCKPWQFRHHPGLRWGHHYTANAQGTGLVWIPEACEKSTFREFPHSVATPTSCSTGKPSTAWVKIKWDSHPSGAVIRNLVLIHVEKCTELPASQELKRLNVCQEAKNKPEKAIFKGT